jgi:hypothetical protein
MNARIVAVVALLGASLAAARRPGQTGAIQVIRAAASLADSVQRVFSAIAVRELAALRPGITPAEWLRAHPLDSLALFDRRLNRENDDRWCAVASSRGSLSDSSEFVRYAYFYPPSPPASLSLPSEGGKRLLLEQCHLGVIWIETPIVGDSSGIALANETSHALTGAYGAVRPAPDQLYREALADSTRMASLARLSWFETLRMGLSFWGSAHWRAPGRWQIDSTVIVSAYDQGVRMLAFAFLPASRFGVVSSADEDSRMTFRKAAALAGEAAQMSGIDARLVSHLLRVFAIADTTFEGSVPNAAQARRRMMVDSAAQRVLNDWMTAARPLDPARRAAALLAADQVVGSAPFAYLLAQDEAADTRQAFIRLGAVFEHNELGANESYTHSLLREAWNLDSLGRVGRLASLAMLRIGFDYDGMCGGGPEPFRLVSTVGERLLANLTDSTHSGEVQLLIGDGYADVVALASGAGAEYADTAEYTGAAADARLKAIEHYRLGISLDRHTSDARRAWLEAWRLLAGLPPTTTHFFCVYD